MTSTRSLPTQSEDAAPQKAKRFGLSWTQIIAAGFASITATVILSFFSISGTLVGAAVFSMASAVGNAVYGQSLRKTQDRVLDVLPVGGKADPASPTVVLPVTGATGTNEASGADTAGAAPSTDDEEPTLPVAAPVGTLSRRAWKRVALTAVAIFAFVIAVVTTVELIAGKPLTDVLRGEKGSGTSFFNPTSDDGPVTPTMTVTVTPKVVVTTPTVTQTAPPSTTTTTPSGATTAPSTGASGGSGTGSPSGSGSASNSTPSPSQSSSP